MRNTLMRTFYQLYLTHLGNSSLVSKNRIILHDSSCVFEVSDPKAL
jgi:hypothetical protein